MAWDNLIDKYQVNKQSRTNKDYTLRSSYNIQKRFNDTRKNKVFERIYTSLKEDEDVINKSNTFISEKLSQISNSSPSKTLNMSEFSQKSAQKSSGFSSRQYNRSKSKNQEAIKEAEKDGYLQTNHTNTNTNNDNIYISDQQFENTSQNKSELSQNNNNNQNQLRFFSKMFISQSMGMSYENIEVINQKQDQLFQSYLKSSTITDQDIQKIQQQNQNYQNDNNNNIKYNFGSSNQVLNTNMSIEEDEQNENESGKQMQNIEAFLESTNKVYFVNQKKNNIAHLEKTANF